MSYLGLSAKRCELFTGASAIGSGSNRPGFVTPDLQLSSAGLDLFEQLTTGAHSAAAALFLAAQFAGGDVGQQGVGVDLAGASADVVGLEQNLGLQGARPPVIRWAGPYGAVVTPPCNSGYRMANRLKSECGWPEPASVVRRFAGNGCLGAAGAPSCALPAGLRGCGSSSRRRAP